MTALWSYILTAIISTLVIAFWITYDMLAQRVTELEALVQAHQALLAAIIDKEV